MKTFVFAALVAALSAAAPSPAAEAVAVSPSLWDRPRSAQAVMSDAGVRSAAASLANSLRTRLVIRHAPGVDAALQAEELRSWLVALAIAPERTAIEGGLKPGEPLKLEIVP